ncbi:hypothetical protein ACIRPU_01195 [Streptomyces sp. NPDC102259]|uniref:hypothetical protein n=1 Tax=Streptomyces sp. NPDC102259 TaxID=3366148 RepID=UPI003827248E
MTSRQESRYCRNSNIPFGTPSDHPQAATNSASTPVDQGNPLLERLDPDIGARLLALNCRLVWATTWMERANEVVAPRIGLPNLPVADWPDTAADAEPGPRGLHWKTRHLVEWADGRPFIWVDDEISSVDRLWVAAQHPGPSLLHRVEPALGLTDADFSAITDWLDIVAQR